MSEIVDKAKALMSTYEQLLEHTRNERDALRAELARLQRNEDCVQRLIVWATENGWNGVDNSKILDSFIIGFFDELRAELAAAKNLLARIHRDGGHHTEAVGFARSVADAGDKVSEWLLAAEERTALAAHVERLEKALKMWRVMPFVLAEFGDHGELAALSPVYYHNSMSVTKDALAATPAQSPETNGEQDFWARMQGPLVHCPNTASTSTGSSAAIELHAKQLREALETLNHAAKVAISSLYGSSFDEDTPLVIRLLDGTCDATDAVLAATPAQSLAAHDAALLRDVGERLKLVDPLFPGDYDRIAQAAEILELIAWAEGEQIEIHKTMNGVHVIIGWGPLEFHGDTLIDTLRRAREVAR